MNAFHNKLLISAFVTLISLPLIFSMSGIKKGDTISENRQVAAMPRLDFRFSASSLSVKSKVIAIYLKGTKFIRQFDDFYSGTFSFRSDLLKLYYSLKSDLFQVDPLPQKVVQGEDGWFFLGDDNSNVIKESKAIENFSREELDAVIGMILKRNAWLHKKHIQFYLAVAPNKLSVYGNYLSILRSGKKTMTEQLDSASFNKFSFISLKNNFPNQPTEKLFHKTDSHWNDNGAFLGYSALIEKIKFDFPDAHVLNKSDFLVDTTWSYQQDLTRMLSISVREEIIRLNYKNLTQAIPQAKQLSIPKNFERDPKDYEERYKSNVNNIKVVIFRDSFTMHLVKYLKESFGETVFIWSHHFDEGIIEREQPDIVIQIIVERNLQLLGR